jgi:hypothetical protein
MTTSAETRTPATFTMVTPPGWFTLDLSGGADRQDLRRLVAERAGYLRAETRDELTRSLEQLVTAARAQRACLAAVHSARVGDDLIGASMVAAAVDAVGRIVRDGVVDLDELRAVLGVEERLSAIVDLPAGQARRVQSRQESASGDQVARAENVQYFLPVPGRAAVLLVTFSTPTLRLAEAYGELFDTMAASIEWVWAG